MVRLITTLLLCLFVGITANASQITEQQALQVAAKYADIDIKSHPQRMKAAGKQQKTAAYYAFNIGDNDGFVIVSGDDSLTELVGYSDSGSFDPDNMPDNMRSWLQAYSGYVASVQAGDSKAKRQQLGNVTTIVVRPFVTTEWNQGEPYDRLTPLLDNGAHCATGCVATAMAQVMKYYEWPERGEGSNSYEYGSYGTLSMDFSQSVYDWDNMLDIYSSYYDEDYNIIPEYNDTQAGAVAKLMYDCGISVNMMYGNSSGAYDPAIPNAFNKFFKYKSSLYYRDNMSSKAFMDILLSELDGKRPVLICGSGLGGGHAFVADGYDSNNFVHINWGWGGLSDGYFNVNYLDPSNLGTGGGSGAFQWGQSMTTAYPNYTGETPEREQMKFTYVNDDEYTGGISIAVEEFQQSQPQEVFLTNVQNIGGETYYGYLSAAVFDTDGNMVATGLSSFPVDGLPSSYYYQGSFSVTLDFSQLSDGEYEIYGISKENSNEYDYDWIKFESTLHIKIRVGNDIVTVIPQEYDLSLTKQIEKPEKIYIGGNAEFIATIRNNSPLTADGYIAYAVRRLSDNEIVHSDFVDAIIYDYNEYAAVLNIPIEENGVFEYSETYAITVTGFYLLTGETIPVESAGFDECTFTIDEGTPQRQLSFYDFGDGIQPGISIDADYFDKNTPQDVNITYAFNPDMQNPFEGLIAIAVCDADNQIVLYSPHSYGLTMEPYSVYNYDLTEATPDMSGLADGLYSIIPVSMENGASEWVRFDYPAKIDIDIKGDYAYVRRYEYSISQESAIAAAGELTSGGMGVFNVEMRNNSEEDAVGDLHYEIIKQADGNIVVDETQRIYLPAYTTTAISIEQLLADDIFSEGAYTIAITGYQSATYSDFTYSSEFTPSEFYVGTSGVNAIESGSVAVYPNPAKDYITVDCSERISSVTIYSASGQLVKSIGGADAEGSIYVGDLPAGYYIVAVDTESGATVRKQVLKH